MMSAPCSKGRQRCGVAKVESTINGTPASTSDLSKQRQLNEYLLKRWVSFLDAKNAGKIKPLDPWFALDRKAAASQDPVPIEVTRVTQGFQRQIEMLLNVKEGVATTNLVATAADKRHVPGQPRFLTPVVTKVRPTAGVDLDIAGFKDLFLVVSDGGNGKSCDHADWIAPTLVSAEGKELSLTKVKWKKAEGFAATKIDRNYQGKPIRVGGKTYPSGFGIHAPSLLHFELPPGYVRFKAIGGLDNSGSDQAGGCGDQASVQFSVYSERPAGAPTTQSKDLLTKILGKDGPLAVADQDLEQFLTGASRTKLTELKNELAAAKSQAPAMYAIAHAYAEGKPADMNIFVRGNPANKRELAPRRFLRVIAGEARPSYTDGSGRKQLALAVAAADNPLTPRVIVNRVWQWRVGIGLVPTPNDFGRLGQQPTHPALLDWLTARFIEDGFSLKRLHKQLVMSEAWLQSAHHPDVELAQQRDPADALIWRSRVRRLRAEEIRDAMLFVSGKLDDAIGGPSVEAKTPRRGLYVKSYRNRNDTLLHQFDMANGLERVSVRNTTTTPTQALAMFNGDEVLAHAGELAKRVEQEADSPSEAVQRAIQLSWGRAPSDDELARGLAFVLRDDAAGEPQLDSQRMVDFCHVLFNSGEFLYVD